MSPYTTPSAVSDSVTNRRPLASPTAAARGPRVAAGVTATTTSACPTRRNPRTDVRLPGLTNVGGEDARRGIELRGARHWGGASDAGADGLGDRHRELREPLRVHGAAVHGHGVRRARISVQAPGRPRR